jgi:hypothetical protein
MILMLATLMTISDCVLFTSVYLFWCYWGKHGLDGKLAWPLSVRSGKCVVVANKGNSMFSSVKHPDINWNPPSVMYIA